MAGIKIKFLGHAGFKITSLEGKILFIDPWLSGNPLAPVSVDEIDKADFVLVTHDHFDHMGDAPQIIQATGATLICMPETIERLIMKSEIQDSQVIFGMGMNIGGTANLDGISITMTQAFHSAQSANPAGFIIKLENGFTIYHAGDTGVFASMKTLGDIYKPDLAMLPIGNIFTMDPVQAAYAAGLLGAGIVVPMHYGTFPVLEQDPLSFIEIMKKDAPDKEVIIIEPGQEIDF